MLPFTTTQFFAVFTAYNEAIWPAQLAAVALGAAALLALSRPSARTDQIVLAILAVMWAWTGVLYFIVHFAPINPASTLFGAGFVLQAGLLVLAAMRASATGFAIRPDPPALLGLALIAYALVVYPAIGMTLGHALGELPAFGVTPCPVVLFTFGTLLLAQRVPWWLLVIPFVWSLIGGSAAFLLSVPQDFVLLLSGVLTLFALGVWRRRARGAAVDGRS
jgi:hypothetical protein